MRSRFVTAAAIILIVGPCPRTWGQDEVVPHGQDRPPNPARSPEEAVAAMTVPEGFTVEVVAAEPDLVNPVAMTFDEKGRIWVTESLEYPRKEAGPGRDRVKVLEDTDGDGAADRFTIFAEGLNIPSGIAVGRGGVWVANSPDILFYPNADGDLVPDGPPEVVVTGFGRDDTHELPNSLTWGPDGWLYGWNGVFNRSVVEHDGETFDFTCAVFRIQPESRRFELFCEGTSNPWGITFDPDGSLFASACVIDHLWHLVETGYYHRQGGPYPPYTWKIESIVDHLHQKRAYCGITYLDTDAYPDEYRDRLYMGNIHGNCINVDSITRDSASYQGHAEADFLAANDAWFMPVVQKVGPDGSLYVLDWYDRYHCYQDANRDPDGIDRLKGRLYRVRYGDTPRRFGFDLAESSDQELIELLGSGNGYDREIAQRLLTERLIDGDRSALPDDLTAFVLDADTSRKARMHGLWALVGSARTAEPLLGTLLALDDPAFRAWGVRAAANLGAITPEIRERIASMATDPSPDVRLQVAIASRKVDGLDSRSLLATIVAGSGEDELIPRIVWRNLLPDLGDGNGARRFLGALPETPLDESPGLVALLPRLAARVLDAEPPDYEAVASVLGRLIEGDQGIAAGLVIEDIADRFVSGQLTDADTPAFNMQIAPVLEAAEADEDLRWDLMLGLAFGGDSESRDLIISTFRSSDAPARRRLRGLDLLVWASEDRPEEAIGLIAPALIGEGDFGGSAEFRGGVLDRLGRLDDPGVAELVLRAYPNLEAELKPRAVGLLTQRPTWTRALLAAIGRGELPTEALNVTQVRSLLASPDPELVALVRSTWGTVREGRDPARDQVIDRVRARLDDVHADPIAGRAVFEKVCAQCHQLYGKGEQVGPDITGNGRSSYEQLLSNILDPGLVIGASYQATIVATADGRVLTGLLDEDSDQRIVLKLQGGKREVIPRSDVDAVKISPASLMPENLEEQVTPDELAALFAYLCLDRAPEDPEAEAIDGTPPGLIAPAEGSR